jgi:cytochrome c
MFKKSLLIAVASASMSLVGWAAHAESHASELAAPTGDPEAGEVQWRQCRSCHMITAPDGDVIQRGGRVGPNLYGIVGQQAGTVEGFRYSEELVQAGEDGLIWDEASFVAYVEDPTGFIREFTGDPRARSPMNFQMRSGAEDMYAYLATFSN